MGIAALLGVEALLPATSLLFLEEALTAVDARDVDGATIGVAGLCLVTLAATVAKLLRTGLSKRVAWSLAERLRRVAHGRMLEVPDGRTVGDRLALLSQEADQVQLGLSAGITLARDPVALLGLAAAAVWVAPTLALVTLLALVVVGGAAWGSTRWVARAARAQREARATLLSLAGEQLQGRDVIVAHGALEDEASRFRAAARHDRDARWWLDVVRGVPGALTQTLGVVALGGVLLVGVRAAGRGSMEPASVLAFAAGLFLALRPLMALAEAGSLWRRARAALERVDELVQGERPPWATEPSLARGSHVRIDGATLGEAVGPIHLEVPEGQWVVLMGATGAGKTTLLRWLAGLQEPDGGSLSIGGASPCQIPPVERPCAYVPQDSSLFARSVADNVAMGQADLDVVARALSTVSAAGIPPQQRLGPDGAPLSGGERQRIALARALVLARPVWLLDEPTAHLDTDTRDRVVAALREVTEGCTVVCATHDEALAAAADRVLLMDGGRVVADGPPQRVLPRQAGA